MNDGKSMIVRVVEVDPETGKTLRKFDNKGDLAVYLESPKASISHASKNRQVYTVKGKLFVDFPKGQDLSETEISDICKAAYYINRIRKENSLTIDKLSGFNMFAKFVLP